MNSNEQSLSTDQPQSPDHTAHTAAGDAVSPTTALASLRQAVKQVEHEDYLDGQAAITEAISSIAQEHGIQDIIDTSNIQNSNDLNTPKLAKPNRRASVNEDAKLLMEQMGVPLQPKPSDSIAIEKDVNELLQHMDSSPKEPKQTKPMNARYLRALEAQKRQQKSINKSSTNANRISTTLSDISQILVNSEDQKWCEEFSQNTFKSFHEEMLFRSMQKVITPKNKSMKTINKSITPYEINRQTIKQKQEEFQKSWSRLGTHRHPSTTGNSGEYMRYDDSKNCTFHPKTNESKNKLLKNTENNNNSDENNDNERNNSNTFEKFISRQEAKERARRQDNEFTKGKEDYEKYEINKKYCPRCGGKQSYDEVKEKRKNCPNCHVAYRPRTCWGDIENNFYERQNKYYIKYQQNEEIRKKLIDNEDKKVEIIKFDKKSGEIRHIIKQKGIGGKIDDENGENLKWTKELEKEFFQRQENYKENIQNKLLKVEEEMYGRRERGRDDDMDDDDEEGENSSSYYGGNSSRRRTTTRSYYYEPQRTVGNTWSVDERNEHQYGRSTSVDRMRMKGRSSSTTSSYGIDRTSTTPLSSRTRRIRDENEYLFRYRRK